MDLPPIYRSAVRQFDARVRLIRPKQWASPTPADEWTVADLVAHVVDGQRDVPRVLAGSPARPRDDGEADSRVVEAWEEAASRPPRRSPRTDPRPSSTGPATR